MTERLIEAMSDADELRRLVAQDEGQAVEFKLESERQADLAETLVAFANAQGGDLLVGVTDDGQVVGVERPKNVIDRLHAAARRVVPSLHSAVTVTSVVLDSRTVVIAAIAGGLEATYSLAGRFVIREGSFNRSMSPADVLQHAARRGTLDYEGTPVLEATLNDLNEKRVMDFLAQRLRTGTPARSLDELLQTLGAAKAAEGIIRPTVAGLLCFGNWPQFYFNHATILAGRLVGPLGTQILDRAIVEGTLPEMVDKAVQFVARNTRHGLRIGDSWTARAREVDEYPPDAVREAITNACCHRDYLERSPIQLKIYDDRLVVANPGGLLPGLDVAHLEGQHRPRNPRLADWFHNLGYVERFGVGLIRMREAMEQAGLPAPEIQATPASFTVTLRGPGPVDAHIAMVAQPATAPTMIAEPRPWYATTWG
jgi:ATP-dependent DNA helicase RecG